MKTKRHYANNSAIVNKYLIRILSCFLLLAVAKVSNAQKNWSFEIRTGADFSTKDLGDANLKTGFGLEGNLLYRFMPTLAAYAGWGWNKFSADQSFAGKNTDFEETGYGLGLQFFHPVGSSSINYMVKGGAIYNHIETENSAGKIVDDSGHGLGWQLGAGVILPLGTRLHLIPEVRYRSLSRHIKSGNVSTAVDLNYISGSVGLSWSF